MNGNTTTTYQRFPNVSFSGYSTGGNPSPPFFSLRCNGRAEVHLIKNPFISDGTLSGFTPFVFAAIKTKCVEFTTRKKRGVSHVINFGGKGHIRTGLLMHTSSKIGKRFFKCFEDYIPVCFFTLFFNQYKSFFFLLFFCDKNISRLTTTAKQQQQFIKKIYLLSTIAFGRH